jgi:hypothetical protein
LVDIPLVVELPHDKEIPGLVVANEAHIFVHFAGLIGLLRWILRAILNLNELAPEDNLIGSLYCSVTHLS